MPPIAFPEPWVLTQGRLQWPSKCYQKTDGMTLAIGRADCLYLNVFVPRAEAHAMAGNRSASAVPREPLPVMFFIHGGSFREGDGYQDGNYDASALAVLQGVIVVTSNYRVGWNGFLVHPA